MPDGEPAPALSLSNVSHRFGSVVAVDDLAMDVRAGEIVCLLGPSGCGKTTALRVAAGLEPLQHGSIWLGERRVGGDGVDVPPEDRGIGLVFQDYALFPHLSVIGNVIFGLRREAAAKRRARGLEVLDQVAMADYADAYPHALSGGQQQRVALARALAPEPTVMLLDEPFSGLDSRLRDQVRDQTLHVLKESGTATLIVTHDPEEAMFLADRIVLMRGGKTVQNGTPSELYFRPVSPFVTEFFSDINKLTGVAEDGQVTTPLGRFAATSLANGTPVEVLIRPEGLRLEQYFEEGDDIPTAMVLAARLLGRSSLIHLSMPLDSGGELHLHARVPGRFLPVEDRPMGVRLDLSQAFVFPAGETK